MRKGIVRDWVRRRHDAFGVIASCTWAACARWAAFAACASAVGCSMSSDNAAWDGAAGGGGDASEAQDGAPPNPVGTPGDGQAGGGPSDGGRPDDSAPNGGPVDGGRSNGNADAGSSGNPGSDAGARRTADAGAGRATDAGGTDGGFPAGWLFTSGGKIYVSNGSSGGTPWMGRGVNIDDLFLCGYNNTLWMTSPDQTLETIVSGLMSGWKPTFVRISLGMASFTATSWFSNPSQYKTPVTNVIDAIGANANVYVLVTLRSDGSMIGQDTVDGDPEATGLPSDSTTTPDAATYPTGTDAVYVGLVDTFANAPFVMFGISNEPGGNKLSNATIAAAMDHAVGVIRGEEDRLGVPHHVVSVQGNSWTSDISFYAATPAPITHDNVVYEVHGYPPATASYTYPNIPVILGEYGSITSSTSASFYADLEAKGIPNLAWDFEPFSNCAPDLLNVTSSASSLTATSWGSIVQSYLLAHAP
ncbi:MAG TPA: cellulase family glycosylhydrolase [Polyangiaceae bacterium]|nr:cellulase family glycosylhydrolase [Polyangiaceae bacterium]